MVPLLVRVPFCMDISLFFCPPFLSATVPLAQWSVYKVLLVLLISVSSDSRGPGLWGNPPPFQSYFSRCYCMARVPFFQRAGQCVPESIEECLLTAQEKACHSSKSWGNTAVRGKRPRSKQTKISEHDVFFQGLRSLACKTLAGRCRPDQVSRICFGSPRG